MLESRKYFFNNRHPKKLKIISKKIIYTFQHNQTRSQRLFLSGYRGSKCQAIKKRIVTAVPIEKPVMTFMLPPKS